MRRLPFQWSRLHRHYRSILAVAAVATAVGTVLSLRLTVDSDVAALLPESATSVQALRRMQERVGGLGELRIVIETGDFDAAVQLARDLEPRLLESPYVKHVEYGGEVEFYRRNALLFLDTASLDSLHAAVERTIADAKQTLNPLMVDDLFGSGEEESGEDELARWEAEYRDLEPKPFYANADSTVLVVKALASQSNADLTFGRAMVADVERIVEEASPERYAPDLRVYHGGNVQNQLDEYETVIRDILGTAAFGLWGVFLLIVLYFRRIAGALLISVCLLASLSWTFGITYLTIGHLNTITGFLFVILFGLGIDYGIHALARYTEARESGLEVGPSLERMVGRTGRALATTAVTTSAAFYVLILMDFRGFSDLGFIVGTGILMALLAMVVVLPALIVAAEKLWVLRLRPRPERMQPLARRPFRHAGAILGVASVATLAAAWLFTQVRFEYDFTNLRAITPQRELVSEKTRGVFTLSESPAVVIADSRDEVEEIVEAVRRKIEQDTLTPTIETVRSVFSLVPADQPERLERIRRIRRLVEEEAAGVVEGDDRRRLDELRAYLAVDEPFGWEDVPERVTRQFIDTEGEIGNFVFIYPSVPLRDGRNAIAFRDDVGTITTESGATYHAASSNLIAADMLTIMIREGKVAVALAFLVVFAIVAADFRSVKAAALVLSPLAVGVLWMGGAMYLLGMKLNFFNVVVIPNIIGIGVDNGVHIYHRYLEEGAGSLYRVLRTTGVTITATTATTIMGYSGLVLASHPGLRSIGHLAVIGLLTTLAAALVFLPSLLGTRERGRVAREG